MSQASFNGLGHFEYPSPIDPELHSLCTQVEQFNAAFDHLAKGEISLCQAICRNLLQKADLHPLLRGGCHINLSYNTGPSVQGSVHHCLEAVKCLEDYLHERPEDETAKKVVEHAKQVYNDLLQDLAEGAARGE